MIQYTSHNGDIKKGYFSVWLAPLIETPNNKPANRAVIILYEDETIRLMKNQHDEYMANGDIIKYTVDNFKKFLKLTENQISSPKEKIMALKDCMGFNISEIAAILQVERPTIYNWLTSEAHNLHDNNRKRLDEVYMIYQQWAETNLGRIYTYLRRSIIGSKSLFDLLSCQKINHQLVTKALESLKLIIKEANKEKEVGKNFISKHGLGKVTKKRKERMRKRHRSIG